MSPINNHTVSMLLLTLSICLPTHCYLTLQSNYDEHRVQHNAINLPSSSVVNIFGLQPTSQQLQALILYNPNTINPTIIDNKMQFIDSSLLNNPKPPQSIITTYSQPSYHIVQQSTYNITIINPSNHIIICLHNIFTSHPFLIVSGNDWNKCITTKNKIKIVINVYPTESISTPFFIYLNVTLIYQHTHQKQIYDNEIVIVEKVWTVEPGFLIKLNHLNIGPLVLYGCPRKNSLLLKNDYTFEVTLYFSQNAGLLNLDGTPFTGQLLLPVKKQVRLFIKQGDRVVTIGTRQNQAKNYPLLEVSIRCEQLLKIEPIKIGILPSKGSALTFPICVTNIAQHKLQIQKITIFCSSYTCELIQAKQFHDIIPGQAKKLPIGQLIIRSCNQPYQPQSIILKVIYNVQNSKKILIAKTMLTYIQIDGVITVDNVYYDTRKIEREQLYNVNQNVKHNSHHKANHKSHKNAKTKSSHTLIPSPRQSIHTIPIRNNLAFPIKLHKVFADTNTFKIHKPQSSRTIYPGQTLSQFLLQYIGPLNIDHGQTRKTIMLSFSGFVVVPVTVIIADGQLICQYKQWKGKCSQLANKHNHKHKHIVQPISSHQSQQSQQSLQTDSQSTNSQSQPSINTLFPKSIHFTIFPTLSLIPPLSQTLTLSNIHSYPLLLSLDILTTPSTILIKQTPHQLLFQLNYNQLHHTNTKTYIKNGKQYRQLMPNESISIHILAHLIVVNHHNELSSQYAKLIITTQHEQLQIELSVKIQYGSTTLTPQWQIIVHNDQPVQGELIFKSSYALPYTVVAVAESQLCQCLTCLHITNQVNEKMWRKVDNREKQDKTNRIKSYSTAMMRPKLLLNYSPKQNHRYESVKIYYHYDPYPTNITSFCCTQSDSLRYIRSLLLQNEQTNIDPIEGNPEPQHPSSAKITIKVMTSLGIQQQSIVQILTKPQKLLRYIDPTLNTTSSNTTSTSTILKINILSLPQSTFTLTLTNPYPSTLKYNIHSISTQTSRHGKQFLNYLQYTINQKLIVYFCPIQDWFTLIQIKKLFRLDRLPMRYSLGKRGLIISNDQYQHKNTTKKPTNMYNGNITNITKQMYVKQLTLHQQYFQNSYQKGANSCYQMITTLYIKLLIESEVLDYIILKQKNNYNPKVVHEFIGKQFEIGNASGTVKEKLVQRDYIRYRTVHHRGKHNKTCNKCNHHHTPNQSQQPQQPKPTQQLPTSYLKHFQLKYSSFYQQLNLNPQYCLHPIFPIFHFCTHIPLTMVQQPTKKIQIKQQNVQGRQRQSTPIDSKYLSRNTSTILTFIKHQSVEPQLTFTLIVSNNYSEFDVYTVVLQSYPPQLRLICQDQTDPNPYQNNTTVILSHYDNHNKIIHIHLNDTHYNHTQQTLSISKTVQISNDGHIDLIFTHWGLNQQQHCQQCQGYTLNFPEILFKGHNTTLNISLNQHITHYFLPHNPTTKHNTTSFNINHTIYLYNSHYYHLRLIIILTFTDKLLTILKNQQFAEQNRHFKWQIIIIQILSSIMISFMGKIILKLIINLRTDIKLSLFFKKQLNTLSNQPSQTNQLIIPQSLTHYGIPCPSQLHYKPITYFSTDNLQYLFPTCNANYNSNVHLVSTNSANQSSRVQIQFENSVEEYSQEKNDQHIQQHNDNVLEQIIAKVSTLHKKVSQTSQTPIPTSQIQQHQQQQQNIQQQYSKQQPQSTNNIKCQLEPSYIVPASSPININMPTSPQNFESNTNIFPTLPYSQSSISSEPSQSSQSQLPDGISVSNLDILDSLADFQFGFEQSTGKHNLTAQRSLSYYNVFTQQNPLKRNNSNTHKDNPFPFLDTIKKDKLRQHPQ